MTSLRPRRLRLLGLGVALALLATACGGGKGDGGTASGADVGDPVRGGSAKKGLPVNADGKVIASGK